MDNNQKTTENLQKTAIFHDGHWRVAGLHFATGFHHERMAATSSDFVLFVSADTQYGNIEIYI